MVDADRKNIGLPLILLLTYLFMDYARPVNPMGIPMFISVILCVYWLVAPEKHWSPQAICFLLLIGTVASMGPFAQNNYSVWIGFQTILIQVFCVCLPIMHFVNSLRKVVIFLSFWILLHLYLAAYAFANNGIGPGGQVGDENDLALALVMALPMALFALPLAKNFILKAAFLVTAAMLMVGVIVTNSRGGFVGMGAVLLWSLMFSKKKGLAISLAVLVMFIAAISVPHSYWAEMATIQSDVEGTNKEGGDLRRQFWTIATRMFLANPILGVGMNNFPHNVQYYETEEETKVVRHSFAGTAAHSLYFTLLAELGLCGTLIFTAIVYFNLKDVAFLIKSPHGGSSHWNNDDRSGIRLDVGQENNRKVIRQCALAIGGGLVGYLVCGTFITVLTYSHFWILTALIVGLKEASSHNLTQVTMSSDGVRPLEPPLHRDLAATNSPRTRAI